jgi:hypothetical protein
VRSNPPDYALLTRYLLGELAEDESRRIEQECLDDEQTFELLEAIEAELTDDYVRGDLVGRRRERFEKRVLHVKAGQLPLAEMITGCSRRRSLLGELKAWMGGFGLPAQRLVPVAVVAVALVLAVGVGWFSVRRWVPGPTGPEVAKNGVPAAPARETPAPPSVGVVAGAGEPGGKTPFVATFVLTSGGVRGDGEANEIRIPGGAQSVRFRIDLLANEYESYEVSLSRVEGERLFVQNHVHARAAGGGGSVFVLVPARLVPGGSSILTLRGVGKGGGVEVVGKYVIRRVERKG